MKKLITFLFLLLFLTGCEYKVPLTPDAEIPIKDELLGLWEFVPTEENPEELTMLVLKQNPTEYVVRYGKEKDGIYLRAYHVRLDDLSLLIQIECIGLQNEPVDIKDTSIYHLLRYKLKGRNLELKILNSDIIDTNCKTSLRLKEKILANKENSQLFVNPAIFRKAGK